MLTLRSLTWLSVTALFSAAAACAQTPEAEPTELTADRLAEIASAPVTDEVRALHDSLVVMDSHLDTPALLERPTFDITDRHDPLQDYSQVDLPRMIEGGLDGGYWVIYTPQGPVTDAGFRSARDSALLRAMAIQRMLAAHPEHFAKATRPGDADAIEAEGKRIVYQSIENAYPLGEDLSLLETFYSFGVRMVGPVHFANNQFADSATDLNGPKWQGLSPLGEALVREANRLGMVLDASHAHDLAFDDMVALSATPIVLSHSGAKAIYDHPRNIDDERLLKLAESGGVIQMNALGAYLTELQTAPQRRQELRALFEEFSPRAGMTDAEEAEFLRRRREIDAKYPPDQAEFEDYMAHFLHVLDLIGPDHVGVGADWDGGGGVIGMQDIAAFPRITASLLEAGYTEEDLRKIWGGNLTRLLQAAEDHAAKMRAEATAEAANDAG